jgi:hypothetical protein
MLATMQSTTRASPVHARCSKARRTHHAVQTTAKKADTKFQTTSEEKIICRREIVMKTGFLLATSAVLVSPKPVRHGLAIINRSFTCLFVFRCETKSSFPISRVCVCVCACLLISSLTSCFAHFLLLLYGTRCYARNRRSRCLDLGRNLMLNTKTIRKQ